MTLFLSFLLAARIVTHAHYEVADILEKNLNVPNVINLVEVRDTCDPRGMGGLGKVIINIRCVRSLREYENLITHELGHIVYERMDENQKGDWLYLYSNYGHVSGYAEKDKYEDFAETYNVYINHGEWFRSSGPKEKYSFMEELLKEEYWGEKIGKNTFDSTLY